MLQILLYVMIILMVYRMYTMNKSNKQFSPYIELIKLVENKDEFLTKAEEEIRAAETDEAKTKFQILKLWGIAHHHEYENYNFIDELNEIDITYLLENNRMTNDDTMFYYLLAIPNALYKDQRTEEITALWNKVEEKKDKLDNRIDYHLGIACQKFYDDVDDKGIAFMEDLVNGEYEGMTYAKQLIGLYKQTAAVMLMRHYKDTEDTEKYNDIESLGESYGQTRIGTTWMENIGLKTPEVTTTEEVSETVETVEADVIEAEIVEKDSEQIVEEETETGTSFTGEDE